MFTPETLVTYVLPLFYCGYQFWKIFLYDLLSPYKEKKNVVFGFFHSTLTFYHLPHQNTDWFLFTERVPSIFSLCINSSLSISLSFRASSNLTWNQSGEVPSSSLGFISIRLIFPMNKVFF